MSPSLPTISRFGCNVQRLIALVFLAVFLMLGVSSAQAQEGASVGPQEKSSSCVVEEQARVDCATSDGISGVAEADPDADAKVLPDSFWDTLRAEMADVPEGAEFEIDEKTGEVTILSQPTMATPPRPTCSGNGCNSTNPQTTNCGVNAPSTRASTYIRNSAGTVIGLLELRYSNTCRTKWSRLTSAGGTARSAYASLRWSGDPQTDRYHRSGTASPSFWSLQVYSQNPQWKACGSLSGRPKVCTSYN